MGYTVAAAAYKDSKSHNFVVAAVAPGTAVEVAAAAEAAVAVAALQMSRFESPDNPSATVRLPVGHYIVAVVGTGRL